MIKPKSQTFRVKVMLIKLEAVTNRVATRCHASLKIDGEEQFFKVTPELKKNVALFNSQVEFDTFSIQLDEVTGLYQNKPALLQIEIETQGTKMRMGEVTLNLGGILNEKKYRIVSQYPLAKCYDKTAKVRLSVDFIPISLQSHKSEKKELREFRYKDNMMISESSGQLLGSFQDRRSPNIKSRLAQESNLILQDKIYEYEQKLENYRMSQTQIQEKLYDQINSKDQQLTELTIEINRKADQLSAANLENEQLRFRLKQHNEQISSLKDQKKSLLTMIQTLQKSQESTKKQLSVLKSSLENQARTKQNKQKYYSQQLAKYTAKYLQSQQERNKIIFELQTKFKEEIEKKESNHRNTLTTLQKKYEDMIHELKNRINKIEISKAEVQERLQLAQMQIKKYMLSLQDKQQEQSHLKAVYKELQAQNQKLKRSHSQLSSQLQTLNFSYNEMQNDLHRSRSELHSSKTTIEQLKMELVVANQTIDEQHQTITKNNRELQVHQEREYYLTQKFNDQLQIKSINEENIIGESIYYKQEIQRVKGQLKMAEERAEEESHKATELANSIKEVQIELANRGQLIMRLGEEKISLENQIKNVRNQLADMEEAVLVLKEDNMQLSDLLREKKAFYQNDKSLEWSEKIEELQNDISEMVEKFRIEKEHMRDSYKREEAKKKEQINQLSIALKKSRDEIEQLRRQMSRKDSTIKQLEQRSFEIGQRLKQKAKNYQQIVQKVRLTNLQHEQLEKKAKSVDIICQNKLKESQLKLNKEIARVKKLELTRTGYQKLIQILLDYLSRPTSSVVGFQEIIISDVDPEFLGLINLSVKKHCDERTKAREQLKKLQSNIIPDKIQKVTEKDSLRYLQRSHFIEITEKQQKMLQPSFQFTKPKSSSYELDELRDQITRLKREITDFKKKHRQLEEQVSKAQRNADIERSERNQAKRQLEQAQDEVDKLTFQLKRKDKTIIDYQSQIRELQAELNQFKGQRVASTTKTGSFYLSRAELRNKEKEEQTHNNRREIVIKDLEVRLQTKTKELQEAQAEINKVRGQNTTLKDAVLHLNNQLSLIESKYKDRCSKFSSQESQYLQHKGKLEDQLHRIILCHKKQMEQIAEELLKVQEESIYHQKVSEHLRNQISELQKKIKVTRDEFKLNDGKNKKEYEFTVSRLKEQNNQLESTLMGLRSQMKSLKLRQKEEEVRNGSINTLLTKRTEEIERLGGIIRSKEQTIFQLQQKIQTLQGQSDRKIEQLNQLIEQLQEEKLKMEYQLEEYKFTSEGRLLDLQRRLEEARP